MELTVPIKVEIDREKLQFIYDEGYEQGRADERPKAFCKGYDSGYKQGRADAIEELYRVLENYHIDKGNTPTTRALTDIKGILKK